MRSKSHPSAPQVSLYLLFNSHSMNNKDKMMPEWHLDRKGIWTQPWENFNDETKSWEWSVRKINKYKSGSARIPEEDRWRSHSWVIEANSRKSHEDSVSSRSSRLTSRAQNDRCKIEASHLTESVLSHSLLPAPPRGPASCQARQGQNSLRAALFSDSTDSSRFGVIEA